MEADIRNAPVVRSDELVIQPDAAAHARRRSRHAGVIRLVDASSASSPSMTVRKVSGTAAESAVDGLNGLIDLPENEPGVPLRDVQIAARHADPRTTMRYDRARRNVNRHPTTSSPLTWPAGHDLAVLVRLCRGEHRIVAGRGLTEIPRS
jgi:hypothetical protein